MRGFSLLELLIAMSVMGVLAALALPGYQNMMSRALRQEARLALLNIQHRQERHFSQHLRYAPSLTAGGEPPGLGFPALSERGLYVLRVEPNASTQGYTAIASINPRGRQAADAQCAALSIDETGRRRSADSTGGWRDLDADRCWG